MVQTVNGVLVEQQSLALYEGPLAIMTEEVETPFLHWKGAKISSHLWSIIKSFLLWSYETYNAESQLRLYYNEKKNRWKAIVLPQYMESHSLSVKELESHKDREDIFRLVSPEAGWRASGTVHHHCSSSAFQSGTDHKDEIGLNCLHITVGDLDKDVLSVHARASFRRVMYDVDISSWLDVSAADRLQNQITRFPNSWKACCLVKPKPKFSSWGSQRTSRRDLWRNPLTEDLDAWYNYETGFDQDTRRDYSHYQNPEYDIDEFDDTELLRDFQLFMQSRERFEIFGPITEEDVLDILLDLNQDISEAFVCIREIQDVMHLKTSDNFFKVLKVLFSVDCRTGFFDNFVDLPTTLEAYSEGLRFLRSGVFGNISKEQQEQNDLETIEQYTSGSSSLLSMFCSHLNVD